MALERVELFNKKEFLSFLLLCSFILCYSLLINFQNYKNITRFDSYIIDATVLKQYAKTKDSKSYQVLKLKTDNGITFYTGAKESFEDVKGKELTLEIFAAKISFYEYLTTFYAYSRVQTIHEVITLKQKLNSYIASEHDSVDITNIYQALFSATPLDKDLQTTFSTLGVSHLLAISGFHLGVLSGILFFLIRPIYKFFQNRYFPYRNSKSDIFLAVAFSLFVYLNFLGSPPSLLRSFTMLIIGFVLYDRGIKIISMQTLLLTTILLLVIFPKLLFSLGFWLSISGVFYIFLFLIHFKHLSKIWQFIIIPFWVYILMLPLSLTIFSNFSIYHPLSIIWTSLFTIFYPLSILLHLVGFGNIFDGVLESLMLLAQNQTSVELDAKILLLHIVLSFISIYKKSFVYVLITFSFCVLIYAIYHIS
ncbi:ComEC/Rec2 family competence protein [Sulfurimonas sp.]|uniref:ComEC/Rec2 family competence protein n=1 Tax=Sulfurimonas sp. TaxID=2022749 RepID=UPI0025E1EF24|nr:ComEC/Rec2 family competence protein [Sulfurimonas sp.]